MRGFGFILPVAAAGLALTTTVTHVQAQRVSQGSFRPAEVSVTGGFELLKQGDQKLLRLSRDFSTSTQAPDLFLTLGRSSTPLSNSKPPAYPLQKGSYTLIAPLKASQGAQTYAIPGSIDMSQYGSVIIWCRKFNATMAWAELTF